MRNTRRRAPHQILIAAAFAAAAVAGCSSSSSSGGDAGTQQTAAADRVETFHNIAPKVNRSVQGMLPLMRGVESTTYQHGDLTVTFRSTATKLDQTNVENTVRQAKQQPAKKSGKSK